MPLHDWTKFDAGVFHDFHQGWAVQISSALNSGLLPDEYYALIQMPLATTEAEIFPLVFGSDRLDEQGYPREITAEDERQIYVIKKNIIGIHRSSDESLVAKVELVAPGNKSTEAAYRRLLNRVTNEVDRGIHLLLVDVFPPGVADYNGLHNEICAKLGCYSIDLADAKDRVAASLVAGDPPRIFGKPLVVGEELPTMPLFLSPHHSVDVPLEEAYAWSVSRMAKHLRRHLEQQTVTH
jgi:hypothetical protein